MSFPTFVPSKIEPRPTKRDVEVENVSNVDDRVQERMLLTQASSCDYLVAWVSQCTPGGLKQATRGDTSFRCQTHLAATNANLRASPPAVSSSLGEFNYRDNKESQSAADRTSLKSSAELCDLNYRAFGELNRSREEKNYPN